MVLPSCQALATWYAYMAGSSNQHMPASLDASLRSTPNLDARSLLYRIIGRPFFRFCSPMNAFRCDPHTISIYWQLPASLDKSLRSSPNRDGRLLLYMTIGTRFLSFRVTTHRCGSDSAFICVGAHTNLSLRSINLPLP